MGINQYQDKDDANSNRRLIRQQSRLFWLGYIVLLALLFAAAVVRNGLFLTDGMLDPKFHLIHAAYDFNLGLVPLVFAGIGAIYLTLGWFWQRRRRACLLAGGLLVFIGADLGLLRYYISHVEPERLVVRHVRIVTPKISERVRILHIADIQAGRVGRYQEATFAKVAAIDPDLIINTGDFLQVIPPATFFSEWPKLHRLIASTAPRYGTYGVYGDTEKELYSLSPEALAPLEILSSRNVRIQVPGGSISLHGLSLSESKEGKWAKRSVDRWLLESEPSDFRILFGHSPNYALEMAERRIDLCLAGHTHGGQVRLPFYGPLVIDADVPREWARGFRSIGIPYLNVSAGAGSNRYGGLPRMRFLCPTEMTLIELMPDSHAAVLAD